jgi:hypothetical protein
MILNILLTIFVIVTIISISLVCHKDKEVEKWTEEDLFTRKTLLDNIKDDDKI